MLATVGMSWSAQLPIGFVHRSMFEIGHVFLEQWAKAFVDQTHSKKHGTDSRFTPNRDMINK